MRDAFGGIVNISFIVIFIVIVRGYLAFNVNYTKAFRVKNKVITTLEQYEGVCDSACQNDIERYISSIGYNAAELDVKGYECPKNKGYCFKATESVGVSDNYEKVYYNVVTAINIEMPIINKIMPNLKIFQLSGNTKMIMKPLNS